MLPCQRRICFQPGDTAGMHGSVFCSPGQQVVETKVAIILICPVHDEAVSRRTKARICCRPREAGDGHPWHPWWHL